MATGAETLYTFVTGPSNSGKSHFIYSLGEPDAWTSDEEAGIEYRTLLVDESLEVVIFCSIDSSRFDQLLEIPERDLLGYIVMVDSTNPDSWGEAQVMMNHCRTYALLPTMIAANKQDLAGARTPGEVGGWIGMNNMINVQGCVASDGDSALHLFLQLLYSVRYEIDRLDALIDELQKLSTQGSEE